ncbi:MAG: hypothetical protein RXR43_16560 [Sulfolobus sp.]
MIWKINMLEKFMGGSKEAKQGIEAERELIEYFSNSKDVLVSCAQKLSIKIPNSFVVIKPVNRIKCDLMIKGEFTICISVKTVTDASFHQLDRRWLDVWKTVLNMPEDIYKILLDSILRKAKDPKAVFILPKDRDKISKFIKDNLSIILKEIFIRDEEDLRILAIWDKRDDILCMFNIQDVISFFIKQPISFSDEGIIKIGKYITIQRKGGNGSRIKKPKIDPTHPGNQLQFKFKPLEFMNDARKLMNNCCLNITQT